MGFHILTQHLEIPVGIEQLRARAYEEKNYIRSVTVPGTVKVIGERAFADCKNLKKVTLCEGIEVIKSNAFTGCANLKNIRLPASIKEITGWAFWGSGLRQAVLDASGSILIFCPAAAAGDEYVVPKGVREIGTQAFAELHELRRVILPMGLQTIRERAFIDCGLETVSLPDSIKRIESGAFYDCKNLKKITGLKKRTPVEYADEFWRIQGKCLTVSYGTDLPKTRHWEEAQFQKLAGRCAKKDAASMYEMMEYFNRKSLEYPNTVFYRGAANFWLYRSYQYGDQKAAEALEKWIEEHPGQRLRVLPLSSNLKGTLNGYILNALGFPDFEEERAYTLYGVDTEGVVLVNAYESEDGPDEDGFGRETYYDWWYFDDCLQSIPGLSYLHGYSWNDLGCTLKNKKILDMHEEAVRLKSMLKG